jgi:hypothetical protein
MFVNFRIRGISRGVHKLAQTLTLIQKKNSVIFGSQTQIGFFYNLIFLTNQYSTIHLIQNFKLLNKILI